MILAETKQILLSLFILGLLALPSFHIIAESKEDLPSSASNDLFIYIQRLEGSWLSLREDDKDDLWIRIHTNGIEGDKVKIFVSEYCRLGIANYLIFELYQNSLCYVAAVDGDCIYRPIYLDFAEIRYEIIDEEVVLLYESVEAEKENYILRRLVRTHDPSENTLMHPQI